MAIVAQTPIVLDGRSLTLTDLDRLARDPTVEVRLVDASVERVRAGWTAIEGLVQRYEQARRRGDAILPHVYGVTTGFGEFKDAPIEPADLLKLQRNILKSHAVGVGDTTQIDNPANYFPAQVVRSVMALRLNTFLKGHSGVRPEMLDFIRGMLNAGVVPLVPTRGSVGSSGDLCPLAHLFGVLLGQGRFCIVKAPADFDRLPQPWLPATELPKYVPLPPGPVMYKEGIALSNGATFCAAELALVVHASESLANLADVAAALALESVCGRTAAFDERVHDARAQFGQIDSARNIRSLVESSRLVDQAAAVQDAYSLRCAPQVHGASRDAIGYARMVCEAELNAATDNPLFFEAGERERRATAASTQAAEGANYVKAYSAGNFHGQPLALAADFLAIALAELGNISERRTQLLLDRHHNRNLPANLTARGGLNSGLMIAQYCAAGLVSENKVLCHPASVDSIPTSANAEDHNSMASIATRKLRTVLANVQSVLAIEFMVAAQAIEWRVAIGRDPNAVSSTGAPGVGSVDRLGQSAKDDLRWREAIAPARRPDIAAPLGRGTKGAYLAIRDVIAPVVDDRPLDEDIRLLRCVIEQESLLRSVDATLETALLPIAALHPR